MLASTLDSIRLFLHVMGVSIWVGGQFTLAALVPVLRRKDPEIPRIVARAFNKVAWSAFAVLIATGMWNLADIPKDADANYQSVLGVKMLVVALSGLAAFQHSRSKQPKSIAIWGSVSGLTAIAATYLGVLLAG